MAQEIAFHVQAGRVLQRIEVPSGKEVVLRGQQKFSPKVHAGRRHILPPGTGPVRRRGSDTELVLSTVGRHCFGTRYRRQS